MAHLFINRPVFAMVISIVTVLIGSICIVTLPIAQYPEVVPPQVQVKATYRGANAVDVEQTVTQTIEQQLIGIDGFQYVSSTSTNDGACTITLTFELGTDIDMAVVQTQNKVKIAEPLLPSDVTREGVTTKKVSSGFLLFVTVTSPDGRYDDLFLSNFVTINMLDQIGSIPGVGEARLGAVRDYGMRMWIDPDKLAKVGLTAADIQSAVQAQNKQSPGGTIGKPPVPADVDFQYPVSAGGRLKDVEEFKDIIIRANPDGSVLRVRDVSNVELGATDYGTYFQKDAGPAAGVIVYLAPGANALATAEAIKEYLEHSKANFPAGIEYQIPYDSTKFVEKSIEGVIHTFFEAVFLVLLVVFVFLQNWRATLIPLLTVPVSVIGTFIFFPFLGFTVNTISLLGLVLAIGIVVDDAIVVVEAVQHNIDHGKMEPKAATEKAMDEVSGPVVAIAFILASVFVPVAFLGGISGQIYRQFALTIAISVLISAFNALSLSPALAALLLRPATGKGLLAPFYRWFNKWFDWVTGKYLTGVKFFLRRTIFAFLVLAVGYAGIVGLFMKLPAGFLPFEDQGVFFIVVRLPDGASLERNRLVIDQINEFLKQTPGVDAFTTLGGNDIINQINVPNVSSYVVTLKDWDERESPDLYITKVTAGLQQKMNTVNSAVAFAVQFPPIIGLGNGGGFEFYVEDRAGGTLDNLYANTQALIAASKEEPALAGVNSGFRVSTPILKINLDRDKTQKLGINIQDPYFALQAFLGGLYINDFNVFGRTWKVMLQAEPQFRRNPSDINRLFVRARTGEMVPLGTLMAVDPVSGPEVIYRYNRYRAAKISGDAAPGYSSGQANAAMETLAQKNLPPGYGYEWTGTVFNQKQSEGKEPIIFGLAAILVTLLLAALYESWSIPFAVLLSIPLGLLGALVGLLAGDKAYDVYAQIGIITLIGLAAKNAILIVEYAKMQHELGMSVYDAAVEAAHLRLRPILMTSFAFILGVVPLIRSVGAGAGARQVIGIAVGYGMTIATVAGIFVVPALYLAIQGTSERFFGAEKKTPVAPDHAPAEGGD